jgi:MscS family membrane protein
MVTADPMTRTRLLLCLLLTLFITSSARGQSSLLRKPLPPKHSTTGKAAQTPKESNPPKEDDGSAKASPEAEPIPEDPLGRSTPYGCVLGFLQAVNSNDLTKAARYLDTKLPESKAEELAKQLKAVLDSGLSSSINNLSRDPLGNVTDDLRVTREKVGVAETPDGNLEIFLDRVKRPQSATIWLFSSETLARVPDVYAHLGKHDISQMLPAPLVHSQLFGLPLWRWISILVAIALAFLLSTVVTRLLFLILKGILHKGRIYNEEDLLSKLKQPVRLLLLTVAVVVLGSYAMSVLARHYWTTATRVMGTIGIAWLLVRLFDAASDISERRSLAIGAKEKIAVIKLARRLFKILAFTFVLLLLLKYAGVNVSAMLAGLGIGGIALALAAQKTLEDLFGGISIIMRESIRVGDYCRVSDLTGTIEDIGLSSTRLRTQDRTIVSIPNAKIAQLSSENYALRDKFWFHHMLLLRYDTLKDQIDRILADVQTLMEQVPDIESGTSRINLVGMKDASYQIEVSAYIVTPTFELFLVRQQELLLRILATISDTGVHLAFPSQATYLETATAVEKLAPSPVSIEKQAKRTP